MGARRRAPFSTPALARGVAPASVAFTAVARGKSAALVNARFTYNPLLSTLNFATTVAGASKSQIDAVVLNRRDAAGRSRVFYRISGPELLTGSGTATLTAPDRDALAKGLMTLSLVTADGVVAETALKLPK